MSDENTPNNLKSSANEVFEEVSGALLDNNSCNALIKATVNALSQSESDRDLPQLNAATSQVVRRKRGE